MAPWDRFSSRPRCSFEPSAVYAVWRSGADAREAEAIAAFGAVIQGWSDSPRAGLDPFAEEGAQALLAEETGTITTVAGDPVPSAPEASTGWTCSRSQRATSRSRATCGDRDVRRDAPPARRSDRPGDPVKGAPGPGSRRVRGHHARQGVSPSRPTSAGAVGGAMVDRGEAPRLRSLDSSRLAIEPVDSRHSRTSPGPSSQGAAAASRSLRRGPRRADGRLRRRRSRPPWRGGR